MDSQARLGSFSRSSGQAMSSRLTPLKGLTKKSRTGLQTRQRVDEVEGQLFKRCGLCRRERWSAVLGVGNGPLATGISTRFLSLALCLRGEGERKEVLP